MLRLLVTWRPDLTPKQNKMGRGASSATYLDQDMEDFDMNRVLTAAIKTQNCLV